MNACGYNITGTACGKPASGHSTLGAPRCDEHRAHRWLVSIGSSLTLTTSSYNDETSAKREVDARLAAVTGYRLREERRLDLMTARPATEADIKRWDLLVEQDKRWTRKAVKEALKP